MASRKALFAGVGVAVIVVGAGAWLLMRGSSNIQVSGTLEGRSGICQDLAYGPTYNALNPVSGFDPAGTEITFKDASGDVVGAVTTGPSRWVSYSPPPGSLSAATCLQVAPYALSLSRSSFYEVSFSGVSGPLTFKFSDVSDGKFDILTN